LNEVAVLQVRTVSVILVWTAIILLFLNYYFRSGFMFYLTIALVVIAVLVYFIPRWRKQPE